MKQVFVDTSGFYAFLDGTDPFHLTARELFLRGVSEAWELVTTNYIAHESMALIQRRLGWEALDAFLNDLLPRCSMIWVDQPLHESAVERCKQLRERRFSLTDAVSLEVMQKNGIVAAIVQDEHFNRAGVSLP